MTINDALAVATQQIQKDIPWTLENNNYFFQNLNKRKKRVDGGTFIQQPIMPYDSEAQGFINGSSDVINNAPQQTLEYGTLNWKYAYYSVPVTLDDINKTYDSEKAVVDLVKAKTAQGVSSFVKTFSSAIYGSGSDNQGKNLNGMSDIFAASGTAYLGLNNTTIPSWFYLLDTAINGGTAITTVNYANIAKMISVLRSRIGQNPIDVIGNAQYEVDLLLTNPAVLSAYTNNFPVNQQRFQDDDTAKTGFKFIEVNGIKMVADAYCPGSQDGTTADNYLYALSTNSIHLITRYWFDNPSPLDFREMTLPSQPISTSVKYVSCNMINSNRRVNGVFKTLIA